MKKTLLPILALAMVCCTPQRQDTLQVTLTTDDADGRSISLVPMGNDEGSVEMAAEDGSYCASVATSATGFYNLVSVKGYTQTIIPYYVPVTKSESASHLTFGERGTITVTMNPSSAPIGSFYRVIQVFSTAVSGTQHITLKAEIIE